MKNIFDGSLCFANVIILFEISLFEIIFITKLIFVNCIDWKG